MRSLVVLSVCLVLLVVEPRLWGERAADRASALKWEDEITLGREICDTQKIPLR